MLRDLVVRALTNAYLVFPYVILSRFLKYSFLFYPEVLNTSTVGILSSRSRLTLSSVFNNTVSQPISDFIPTKKIPVTDPELLLQKPG